MDCENILSRYIVIKPENHLLKFSFIYFVIRCHYAYLNCRFRLHDATVYHCDNAKDWLNYIPFRGGAHLTN